MKHCKTDRDCSVSEICIENACQTAGIVGAVASSGDTGDRGCE